MYTRVGYTTVVVSPLSFLIFFWVSLSSYSWRRGLLSVTCCAPESRDSGVWRGGDQLQVSTNLVSTPICKLGFLCLPIAWAFPPPVLRVPSRPAGRPLTRALISSSRRVLAVDAILIQVKSFHHYSMNLSVGRLGLAPSSARQGPVGSQCRCADTPYMLRVKLPTEQQNRYNRRERKKDRNKKEAR